VTLLPVDGTTDALRLVPDVLPWIHASGNPYYDWLFGSPARARESLASWMARPTSEIAIAAVTALYIGGTVAGGYIAWPSDEVAARRWADAQALFKAFAGAERQALRRRLAAAADLFLPPEPESYYLSKIGLLEQHRGRGHGGEMVERYLAQGRSLGHTAFSLDVSPENAPALRLYSRFGFVETASRTTDDGSMTYRRLLLRTTSLG
jgi:ribosomal protein S18 acetylase RimI-like enzyme